MKKVIKVNTEPCIGCSLCSLTCSMTWNHAYGLNDSHITVKRNDLDGRFEVVILETCKKCFKCVMICPSSCLEIVEIQENLNEGGHNG
jgi:formate hydrogenlyase subunit 6/NADH:ubiquinone oxidoreductase subunit I